MKDQMRVGIAGAGSIACGTAALLYRNKHLPTLWSPSGRSTTAFETKPLQAHGVFEEEFMPAIAQSAQELAETNDALIIALPATGHKQIMDALAPIFARGSTSLSHPMRLSALSILRRLWQRVAYRHPSPHGARLSSRAAASKDPGYASTPYETGLICAPCPRLKQITDWPFARVCSATALCHAMACWPFCCPISIRRTTSESPFATSPGWSVVRTGARD